MINVRAIGAVTGGLIWRDKFANSISCRERVAESPVCDSWSSVGGGNAKGGCHVAAEVE